MRSLLMVFALMIFIAVGASAQMQGTVSGTVSDEDSNPIENALVRLSAEGWHGGHGGGGHGHHDDIYWDVTEDDGTFSIDEVTPGDYYATAMLMGYGHDLEEITVVGGENTVVNFVLDMGGHDHGDSLEIVELAGYAIVEEDSFYTHYYLDINGDEEIDYRLSFGPYWYDPGSGATRPEHGDSIWIVGGLMGYSEPQTVIVYEINGLFWREPGMGHGGHGGHGGGDCPNPDSVVLVEVNGTAIVESMPNMDMYFLDDDGDLQADYHLNFGAPWYDPGNGATRPEDGDSIDIVGGLMENCQDLPVIIVYEINGQFWREPGDTTSLWFSPTSADDPIDRAVPRDFVLVSNYPNPFNPATKIIFQLPETDNVKITVYNILGREIAVLANQTFSAGSNEVIFDSSEYGSASSTVYFYRLETSNDVVTGKMVMIK